jgi:drug/metabolite transporter (DMT)-like permease
MDPRVVALVVVSALLHALWNAALKRQPDPEGAAVAILAVAGVAAWLAWPLASGAGLPGPDAIGWSLAAGLCEGGYFVTLALALRAAPLGVVYTVSRGGALAVVWPVSALWLGEAVGARSAAAAAVLLLGLVLVTGDRRDGTSARGVLWATICAGFIAGYHLFYKAALVTGAAPAAVFAIALAVALPVNLARQGRSGPARARAAMLASPLVVVAAGLVCTASFLAFLAALASGGAGASFTLRNSSIVFALLLAWLMGERPGRRELAGALAVAAGAVALGWPG